MKPLAGSMGQSPMKIRGFRENEVLEKRKSFHASIRDRHIGPHIIAYRRLASPNLGNGFALRLPKPGVGIIANAMNIFLFLDNLTFSDPIRLLSRPQPPTSEAPSASRLEACRKRS